MNYKDIKDFNERCETHPDHQDGIVSNLMLVQRLHEEIEELRAYIECVAPNREELEKAVADAWRDYDIADAKLMNYYKENT